MGHSINELNVVNFNDFKEMWNIDENMPMNELVHVINKKIWGSINLHTNEIVDEKTVKDLRAFLKKTIEKNAVRHSYMKELLNVSFDPSFVEGFHYFFLCIVKHQQLPTMYVETVVNRLARTF